MSEQIDLGKAEYRHVPDGPLGRPRQLWFLTLGCLVGSVVCALGGWLIGGPFAAMLPIVPSVLVGIGLAGLFPRYWFKEPPSDN